jgi:hypothetical protein
LKRVAGRLALAVTFVLAGCVPLQRPAPQDVPADTGVVRPLPEQPWRGGKPMRIPERPLEVNTECRYRDDAGVEGSLVLEVSGSKVERFASRIDMGRRGSCRFDLSQFRQTAFTPAPTLVAGGCTVSIWEQGDQVTVSYRNCAGQCTPGAHEYLWPTLVSRRTGICR